MTTTPEVIYLYCLPNLHRKCPGKAEPWNKSNLIDHANDINGNVHVSYCGGKGREDGSAVVTGWTYIRELRRAVLRVALDVMCLSF